MLSKLISLFYELAENKNNANIWRVPLERLESVTRFFFCLCSSLRSSGKCCWKWCHCVWWWCVTAAWQATPTSCWARWRAHAVGTAWACAWAARSGRTRRRSRGAARAHCGAASGCWRAPPASTGDPCPRCSCWGARMESAATTSIRVSTYIAGAVRLPVKCYNYRVGRHLLNSYPCVSQGTSCLTRAGCAWSSFTPRTGARPSTWRSSPSTAATPTWTRSPTPPPCINCSASESWATLMRSACSVGYSWPI